MSDIIIKTERLTKAYGKFVALKDLDLEVYRGEIFGYLGPNGAGKTTTIRMFLDLIRATAGRASIMGMDVEGNSLELRRRIGFLPGELNLWADERAINIVRYFARVRGDVDMTYVRDLADTLQFDLNKRIRDYSTGNKRKMGLILAMMGRPELLILDEPTSGLDPLMQQTFNQLMREVRDEGRTVFLSSHVLSEVQAICDRAGVLRNGELKTMDSVENLTAADFRWVTLRLRELNGVEAALNQLEGVEDISINGENTIRLRLIGDFEPLLRVLSDHYVIDIRVKEPTLEEIFLAFYNDSGDQLRHPDMQTAEAAKEYAS